MRDPRAGEKHMKMRMWAAAAVMMLAANAGAAITITEAHPSGSGGATGVDWFELTNLGSTTINLAGYRVDDSSNSLALSQPLNGVASIAPGESVVFIESAAGAAVAGFRTSWNLSAAVQVGFYSGSGLGLSTSGDGVNIFNAGGTNIAGVSFGAATSGVTFGFNPVTSTFGAVSVAGQFGAYTSADSEVGSPGLIPAPSAAALIGLAGLAAGRRRR